MTDGRTDRIAISISCVSIAVLMGDNHWFKLETLVLKSRDPLFSDAVEHL